MSEQFRTRQCVILVKGDTYPVTTSSAMVAGGWNGGQGVQWATSSKDEFLVSYSDGYYAGFMLWGSDEPSDQYTSMTRNQPAYQYGVIGAGGWVIMTTSYEKYTYASRISGPLVPITYAESDRLVFSLRGYYTSQDEWSLSSDPRAPNGFYIAFVVQPPTATNDFMTIQVSI